MNIHTFSREEQFQKAIKCGSRYKLSSKDRKLTLEIDQAGKTKITIILLLVKLRRKQAMVEMGNLIALIYVGTH